MVQKNCRHFNGYKPCGLSDECNAGCAHKNPVRTRILIVHLGALGAVVRSTALLPALMRKYSQAHITWVTDKPADQLLRNHPRIDRVLTTTQEDLLLLSALQFDVALVIDKSLKAAGVLKQTSAQEVLGFLVENHAIVPANAEAEELWSLGLSNHKKFFVNQKTENQLIAEALKLSPYIQDEYDLPLSVNEQALALQRREQMTLNPQQPVIGLNTGCSNVIQAKRLTVEMQRQVIQTLLEKGYENLVLLGGPEDSERNQQIGEGLPVFQTPTQSGLRDGLSSVAACDVVLTGDSLGLHMAVSQKKYVVAWFGPTCAHEIDLYGRGEKILTAASCSPCWKRSCSESVMCYDQVQAKEIVKAIENGCRQSAWSEEKSLSFKPLS
jgi:heptosyltransferase-2